MGTFLLVLFIVFVVYPLCRVAWTVYKVRSQARRAFEEMGRRTEAEHRRRESENRPAGWQQAPRRHKIISENEGEYVEWEEVTVSVQSDDSADAAANSRKTSGGRRQRTTVEQRIVDVEWEDISTSRKS